MPYSPSNAFGVPTASASIGRRLEIDVEHADGLRGVGEKQHVALAAGFADRDDIGAEAGRERHHRRGNEPRPVVDCGDHPLGIDRPVGRFDAADRHAEAVAQVVPGKDIARMFELLAEHDIVAGPPVDGGCDRVDAFRDILGQRDLARIGVHQRGKVLPRTLDPCPRQVLAVTFNAGVEICGDGVANLGRDEAAVGDVQVRTVAHAGKTGAKPFEVRTSAIRWPSQPAV